jgi:hypothetical protein
MRGRRAGARRGDHGGKTRRCSIERRSAEDRQAPRAASDYSSSLLTIDRLEAALASTQSHSVVARNHRVDLYAPRAMRRYARLIDKIGHGQSDGGALVPGGTDVLRLAKDG